jgi:uncharacterized glyoxalase superfamily protein PhnB
MEQRLTMVSLGVKDLRSATDFYENVLGWVKTSQSNESITFFKLNGILLGLYGWDSLAEDAAVRAEGHGFRGMALAYNTRSKEEVDAIFKGLGTNGVRIVKPPQETFWGGYSGYFSDPDGHLWEVAWNPFLPLDSKGDVMGGDQDS